MTVYFIFTSEKVEASWLKVMDDDVVILTLGLRLFIDYLRVLH